MEKKDWLEQDHFMVFPDDYTWSTKVLSVVGTSTWGGGEIGEIYKVCAALQGRVGDNAAWFKEWNAMGERVASLGEKAESEGHLQTASAAFMRAAHYIQTAENYLAPPPTPETQKAYARSVALFKRGASYLPFFSIEPVEVPFENGKSLPAYFVKKEGLAGVRWPTVVFFDGMVITKEQCYFRGGSRACKTRDSLPCH